MDIFLQSKLFTPSKLRYVCMSSNGPERDLAKLDKAKLQPLIDLGMLIISQYNYLNDPLRLERKILWQRDGDEAQNLLDTFDAFYVKAGMPIPVLEGALFVVDDPFAIDQIFCEMQKLNYTDQRMTHYVSGAKLELSQGQLLDARYMSFKIFLEDEDEDIEVENVYDDDDNLDHYAGDHERPERPEREDSPKRLKSCDDSN